MGGIAHGVGRMAVVVEVGARRDDLRIADQRGIAAHRELRGDAGLADLCAHAHAVGLDVLGVDQAVFAELADGRVRVLAGAEVELRRLVVIADGVEAELQIGAFRPPADLRTELAGIPRVDVLAAEQRRADPSGWIDRAEQQALAAFHYIGGGEVAAGGRQARFVPLQLVVGAEGQVVAQLDLRG
ncbi:hypothetical protein D9M71_552140 [compost metagenome]